MTIVMSMKMMSRTSMTSTSGVTLMSLRTTSMCAFLWPDSRQRRLDFPGCPERADIVVTARLRPALAQHVVDELARHVVHVDHVLLDAGCEEVERHGGDDRDAETERGGDERLGDLGADLADGDGATLEELEGAEDADDRAEETDERGRRCR